MDFIQYIALNQCYSNRPSGLQCSAETDFPVMSVIKMKHRNNRNIFYIRSLFRMAFSTIKPRLDKLVN